MKVLIFGPSGSGKTYVARALQKMGINALFLAPYSDVYVFGGSGNVPRVLDLFDRVYFLQVGPELQQARLLSPSRPTPAMDQNEEGFVIWGAWFEEFARQQNIPFIDAALTPGEIYQIISR